MVHGIVNFLNVKGRKNDKRIERYTKKLRHQLLLIFIGMDLIIRRDLITSLQKCTDIKLATLKSLFY